MAKTQEKPRRSAKQVEKPELEKVRKALVAIAEKKKVSQSELASKIGCAPQHVFRAFKEKVPTLRMVTQIANALGMKVEVSLKKGR